MVYTKKVGFKTKLGYSKGRAGRTYTRKKTTVKAVAKQVAKSVIHRIAENKRFTLGYEDLDVRGLTKYYINPIQHVAKGTNENNRVGDVMTNVRLQLSMSYFHNGVNNLGVKLWQGSALRVLVIKSHKRNPTLVGQWSSTPVTAGVFDNLFASDFGGSYSPVNLQDYTLLADQTLHSTTPDGALNNGVPAQLRWNIPLCKRWSYLDNDVYGKFNNIYVIVTVSGVQTSSTDYMGKLQCNGYLTWEDM